MKKLAIPIVVAAITAVSSVWAFQGVQNYYSTAKPSTSGGITTSSNGLRYASNSGSDVGQPVDFTSAAEAGVRSVVHIKIKKAGKIVSAPVYDPFADFFGGGGQQRMQQYKQPDREGGGSGVIISSDGYILTNNHVVDGADEVMVTYNTRSTLSAKVIGTDPQTDLAVIKIDAKDLPAVVFGNSDEVKLGQWVLAVGFPLNLDATVTAGIVSAKSRSIGINSRQSDRAIESFIQTDAAINPGNSGGALVNTQGQLIGVNSAIASPTGSYAGYGYAVPSNLAKKVADDIIKYGDVRRGYLGASLADLNRLTEEQAKEIGIGSKEYNQENGVYVADVVKGSGAAAAGLKKGDMITAINGVPTNSSAVLIEQVARYHPGDKVQLDYLRSGSAAQVHVELKDSKITEQLSATQNGGGKSLGAVLKPLTKAQAQEIGADGGMVVVDAGDGPLKSSGIKPGFVIISVNGIGVSTLSDVQAAIKKGNGMVQIGGTYQDSRRGQYFFSFPYKGEKESQVQ